MIIDQAGLDFIAGNEGFSPAPYEDNGHLAWGYGHDEQPGETPPVSLTPQQATSLLQADLSTRFEPAINALLPDSEACTQSQYNALCDFAYNLGVGSLRTMLAHGWDQVPVQIPRWNHVDGVVNAGLTARRAAEVALFQS